MPSTTWDDGAPRFRPPPGVTLFVPVIVAFVLQVPATIAITAAGRSWGPNAALAIALAAASALALLGARRFPGPTVVAVTALTVAGLLVRPDAGPPMFALAFAIIGAVVRGARFWALGAVGVGWVVAIAIAGVLADTSWHPLRVAVVTVGLGVCFAIGEGIRARRAAVDERRAQLNERRRTAEQDERARIARELHDVLAHSLSQISVQSGVGLHLFDRDPERAREALRSIRALSATGLDEVRGVLSFLRGDERNATSAPLTPQPQLADLSLLARDRSGLGLDVRLDDELRGQTPPSVVQTTAYRIVQEALTNVVRHSGATTATVTLARDADDLVATVGDDGTGMVPDHVAGGGIRGMRERAELAGGTLVISSDSRHGTVIAARLPWRGAP
ncbi:signal transduction histidine kinase [Microbacterium sp. AG1240]|uniref:sensor histidine kinase n=1 Tax=Microbacterium sp. AG1240 TaxID=2183992 RepID=UPI000F2D2A63|nr:histidine kinase [Microbacterium sp. AG1240]RKT31203.1 signal transduction histidine kinase [Microbacterium sp. AG1240]